MLCCTKAYKSMKNTYKKNNFFLLTSVSSYLKIILKKDETAQIKQIRIQVQLQYKIDMEISNVILSSYSTLEQEPLSSYLCKILTRSMVNCINLLTKIELWYFHAFELIFGSKIVSLSFMRSVCKLSWEKRFASSWTANKSEHFWAPCAAKGYVYGR